MKIAKISSAVVMTLLILSVANSAKAVETIPDSSSACQLMLVGLGALGVAYRSFKHSK